MTGQRDVAGGRSRHKLAELINEVTAGEVRLADALAEGVSLRDMGLDSLALLRLIDAIELRYGVELDLADGRLQTGTLEALARRVDAESR